MNFQNNNHTKVPHTKAGKTKSWIIGVIALVACMSPFAGAKSESDFYTELSRLNKVLSEVQRRYVEEVDAKELTDAAVNGLRTVLDPHTVVFDPKGADDLKIHTEGEFGGLGITIAIRDNVLTIITPLQGTPAFQMGLQAGDRIVKIEGKSTKGITTEDAVGKLRGKVGTDVTITIAREGEAELIDYTITRGRIVLQSVPYSGMLKGDIGYIKVTQFSQKTSNDIKEAIRSLQTKGMKKLILDLRFNPGGLLNQAIEVSELFLQKDQLIVSTKGRTQHSEASSSKDGMVGSEVPMIVLINQGSASASEIVAGALQDWDRALVLGKTSFGKGSVQTIFPLTNEGHALKLTTAFYYLPKGRCINKPENDVQSHLTSVFDEELEESPEDSSKQDTAEVYYTANGRKMYGDGGITPDVEVEMDPMSWYIQVLERQTKFFKFAIKERIKVEKQGEKIDLNWKVPQFVLDDFKAFLKTDSTVANLKSNAEQTLNMLDTVLIREQKLTGDTSTTLNNAELSFAVEELRKALQKEKDKQFENNIVAITRALKREFLSAVQGESGRIAYSLEYDQQVKEAIKILQDTKKYQNMLKPAK